MWFTTAGRFPLLHHEHVPVSYFASFRAMLSGLNRPAESGFMIVQGSDTASWIEQVSGIWFYDTAECAKVDSLLQRIESGFRSGLSSRQARPPSSSQPVPSAAVGTTQRKTKQQWPVLYCKFLWTCVSSQFPKLWCSKQWLVVALDILTLFELTHARLQAMSHFQASPSQTLRGL